MRQFIGMALIGTVLMYAMIRDKVTEASAKLMNETLERDRQKKLEARRSR